MIEQLDFHKLSACGNDFIAVDNRTGLLQGDEHGLIQWLCERRSGIGADGLLLVEHSDALDFRMRIFNPDGSEARMCGNGARACAQFAADCGIAGNPLRFETRAGPQEVRLHDGRSRLWLSAPEADGQGLEQLEADDLVAEQLGSCIRIAGFLRVGVPHLVLACLWPPEDRDLEQLGSMLAHHAAFGDEGCNVMFAHLLESGDIVLRSWEKGVEDETWGCGTGAVAACLLLDRSHPLAFPVCVHMRGGDLLVLREDGRISFSGEVHTAFSGTLIVPEGVQ